MYAKYLITGAHKPVGKLCAKLLCEAGCSVRILVPPETDVSDFDGMNIEIFYGEIDEKDSMKPFFKLDEARQSVVIHTDEEVSISEQTNIAMRRVNFLGTQHIVEHCIKNKIARFVYLGSAYALNPANGLENAVLQFDRNVVEGDYAKSKAEAGAYIIEKVSINKFNAVILLPTFIIGPGFSDNYDMNKILKGYLEHGVATVHGGHAFVDVRDVAQALLALAENGQVGGCYILNGEYKSANDFFAAIKDVSGSEKDVKKMPKWMMSKSLGKFVDTYYRITKKDNPKEVYALFRNCPDVQFSNTVSDLMPDAQVRSVHESMTDVLKSV